jgi:hypothetical protein
MNTAAKDVYYDMDNINAKKHSFGHFQTNEAALWLSIKSAQQDGKMAATTPTTDYRLPETTNYKRQKPHRGSVKLMDGIATYFEKHTEPDPSSFFVQKPLVHTAYLRALKPACGLRAPAQ